MILDHPPPPSRDFSTLDHLVVRQSLPFTKKSLAPNDPALPFAHRYVDTEGNLDVESKSTNTIRDIGAKRQEELERLVT
jgi:hypothetical protein